MARVESIENLQKQGKILNLLKKDDDYESAFLEVNEFSMFCSF